MERFYKDLQDTEPCGIHAPTEQTAILGRLSTLQ